MYRREFVKRSGGYLLASTFFSFDLNQSFSESLFFGICTDVHKDLVPDADERLSRFIEECNKRNPDFIIQMGDFCIPKEENRGFLSIFNSFKGPVHHVIGNHDTDGGFKKEDAVKYYGMPGRYYSFDLNKFHFIIMDGTVGSYPWTPEPEQVSWLEADLSATHLPTIVFIHQPLENAEVISNADLIRAILEKNTSDNKRKVIGCFGGHRHMDYMKVVNAIPYFQINSMSYFWMGPKYVRNIDDEVMNKKFPAMKYYSRYKDPLYCFVRVSKEGKIEIEGRSSIFIDGTPRERGYSFETVSSDEVTASITKRVYPG